MLGGFAKWIDQHWAISVAVLTALALPASLFIWSWRDDDPVLLARLDASARSDLYGSLASSAAALLGLVLASIAILLTLDEAREAVRELQSLRAWRVLNVTLLAAAGFFAALLASSTVAMAVDTDQVGSEAFQIAVVSLAISALAELAVGGIAFALVVMHVSQPTP